jgi:hypothetical protein
MAQKHWNPAYTAERILEKVRDRECVTPGQWHDVIYQINRLPPKLQAWTWLQLQDLLPPAGFEYLMQLSEGMAVETR